MKPSCEIACSLSLSFSFQRSNKRYKVDDVLAQLHTEVSDINECESNENEDAMMADTVRAVEVDRDGNCPIDDDDDDGENYDDQSYDGDVDRAQAAAATNYRWVKQAFNTPDFPFAEHEEIHLPNEGQTQY